MKCSSKLSASKQFHLTTRTREVTTAYCMGSRSERSCHWLFITVACVVGVFAFASIVEINAQKRRVVKPASPAKTTAKQPRVDYSKKFSHQTHVVQQKLACNSCHKFPTKNWKDVRKGDDAFPDVAEFPEHASCLGCHRPQFFARERPAPLICANCHIAVTPKDTARYPFPSLGEPFLSSKFAQGFVSEFRVGFPHDKHEDVVGFNRLPRRDDSAMFVRAAFREMRPVFAQDTAPKSCPVCHQTYQPQGKSAEEYVTKPPANLGDAFWLKKGTFKTTPVNHSSCFTCHSEDSGIAPAPADCNACHKLSSERITKTDFDPKLPARMGITDGFILRKWALRDVSATFLHEGGLHTEVSCTKCHNPATMNLLEPKTLKVPVASCGGGEGCHVTATADEGGILNFELNERKKKPDFQCVKCHLNYGKDPVPESHPAAVAAVKK